jgi:hypothetical protein
MTAIGNAEKILPDKMVMANEYYPDRNSVGNPSGGFDPYPGRRYEHGRGSSGEPVSGRGR